MSYIEIGTLDRAHITFAPWAWPFAIAARGKIDDYFTRLQSEQPGVWNGRVLLLNRFEIRERVLHGGCFEADFASFCVWREWQCPDAGVFNVFAAAAVRSADGAYLVGQMAADTAAAGKLYFPCGTPEPADLDPDGRLDLEGNVRRELLEETGLDAAELSAEPGWSLVRDGGYITLLKTLKARQSAHELRDRAMRYIESEHRPELVGIRMLHSPADFDDRMPRFVTAFLTHCWSQARKSLGRAGGTLSPRSP
ncbi:MAG: NUDIX hydrolase [Xanthobacteraceae bacterium]